MSFSFFQCFACLLQLVFPKREASSLKWDAQSKSTKGVLIHSMYPVPFGPQMKDPDMVLACAQRLTHIGFHKHMRGLAHVPMSLSWAACSDSGSHGCFFKLGTPSVVPLLPRNHPKGDPLWVLYRGWVISSFAMLTLLYSAGG